MSKNLNVIMTIAKIVRLVTKIFFIISIVAGSISLLGAITLWAEFPSLNIDGTKVVLNIFDTGDIPTKDAAVKCLIEAIICASNAVILGFSSTYFKNMITDGTPFTSRGANELLRLGILASAIPVVCQIICEICATLLASSDLAVGTHEANVIVGLVLIFTSFLLRHGAEIEGKENIS